MKRQTQKKVVNGYASGLADRQYEMSELYRWCEENCNHRFYRYPSWTGKYGFQFEDPDDAFLFVMRFG